MQFVNKKKYITTRYLEKKVIKNEKTKKHPYCLTIINQYRNTWPK